MPESTFQYDVFLSHSAQDKAIVRELAERLRRDQLRVWFDEWEIKPGDLIGKKIEEGLQQSHVLLLCMSDHAFASDWVTLERHTLLFKDPTNQERRFIPLLLSDCAIPDMLRQFAYVDWRERSQVAYDKIIEPFLQTQSIPAQKAQESYEVITLDGHEGTVYGVAITPDGKQVVSGSDDTTVKVWDLASGKNITTFKGHKDSIGALAITPDGKQVLSGSTDTTVKVWDLASGKNIATFEGHPGGLRKVAITPDGEKVVSSSNDNDDNLKLWDLASGKNIVTLKGHNEFVTGVAITSDGKKVISSSNDKTLKVWDLASEKNIATLEGHNEFVREVAITPDGKQVVSGSSDKTLKVWDIDSGKNIATFEGHNEFITGVAITPDGKQVVSGSYDKTLKVWDLVSGKNIATFEGHTAGVQTVAITPDGKKVVSGSDDMTIKVWDLEKALKDIGFDTDGKVSPTTRYTNAKVALIGDSGAGKTGLAIRLVENDWRPTDSTHGMNVWQLDLPQISREDMEREIWLWDFAGQPDYRLIHQLYMDETALALLVIDPQKEDPFEPLQHWEKALSNAVKTQPNKLLVAARCDRGGLTISKAKVAQYCADKGYMQYLQTAAKNGDGCDDLKAAIATYIPWDALPWTSTSQLFKTLKDAIIQIKEEDAALINFVVLRQRIHMQYKELIMEDADLRTVLGLLEGQGIIKRLDFGDWVLLQPEQINNYASAVVREVRSHAEDIGSIAKDKVLNAELDFKDLERIKLWEEKELLRAMLQILIDKNLCLQEETNIGTQLIFPSYFKIDRPELLEAPNVFVTYSFSGVLDEIYATLIVRLIHTQDFYRDQFWYYAADFMTHTQKRLGLQMTKKSDSQAEIKVYFDNHIPDDTKVSFIKYLHEHLKKHAKDVQRIRDYVCSECGETIEKSRVQKRLQRGSATVTCDNCDFEIPFKDVIEEKFASDLFSQKVQEMDKQADFNIDNESRELILVGHSFTVVAEAGHIFRPTANSDWGIDGEIEFKDTKGEASGKRVYLQLKSGGSYLYERKTDGKEIFRIKNERLIHYWQQQTFPVMLVIRDAQGNIRWMNVSDYLKKQKHSTNQVIFEGEPFTPLNVDNLRKRLYPNT